jgi:hypothetical protein
MTDRYGRDSRYRDQPVVVRTDHTGRTLQVDELRLRRPRPGSFQHPVSDGDRLDQLGHRYYANPRRWYLIADANPEFASPLALLGQEAVRGLRLALRGTADAGPTWELLAALRAHPGVEDVDYDPEAEAVTVRYNRNTTGAGAVVAVVRGCGFEVDTPQPVDRLGRPVVVPPEGVS